MVVSDKIEPFPSKVSLPKTTHGGAAVTLTSSTSLWEFLPPCATVSCFALGMFALNYAWDPYEILTKCIESVVFRQTLPDFYLEFNIFLPSVDWMT